MPTRKATLDQSLRLSEKVIVRVNEPHFLNITAARQQLADELSVPATNVANIKAALPRPRWTFEQRLSRDLVLVRVIAKEFPCLEVFRHRPLSAR